MADFPHVRGVQSTREVSVCRCGHSERGPLLRSTSGLMPGYGAPPEAWGGGCTAALREALDAVTADTATERNAIDAVLSERLPGWTDAREPHPDQPEIGPRPTLVDGVRTLATVHEIADNALGALRALLAVGAAEHHPDDLNRIVAAIDACTEADRALVAAYAARWRTDLDAVTAERDRLRDILDAETGKRGLEGWAWTPHDTWSRYAGQGAPGPSASVWRHADMNGVEWSWRIDRERRGTAKTALEAMEAADLAAKEQG